MHMVYKKYVCCCHAEVEVACKVWGDDYKSKWVLGIPQKRKPWSVGLYLKKGGNHGTCRGYVGIGTRVFYSPPFPSFPPPPPPPYLSSLSTTLLWLSSSSSTTTTPSSFSVHSSPTTVYHSNGLSMGASPCQCQCHPWCTSSSLLPLHTSHPCHHPLPPPLPWIIWLLCCIVNICDCCGSISTHRGPRYFVCSVCR